MGTQQQQQQQHQQKQVGHFEHPTPMTASISPIMLNIIFGVSFLSEKWVHFLDDFFVPETTCQFRDGMTFWAW